MASLNKVILIGRLGRDPDTRATNGGGVVTTFSVATDETWRDKQSGERKQRTEWHNVVIFNESLGKIAEQYLRKGAQVYLEGMQCTREYTDKEGVLRRTTEVVLKQYRGELVLLDSQKREPPSEASYGRESTRDASQERSAPAGANAQKTYDDPRMSMGDRPAPPRNLSNELDDDIPF
jgi:single-strand DNA-binding protein